MKLKYLGELAGIVVGIDEDKNISYETMVMLTDRAWHLIKTMKLSGMDVGSLQENFAGILLMCDDRVALGELMDMAHEEIARLLGLSAWRVYGYDDILISETSAKVAA